MDDYDDFNEANIEYLKTGFYPSSKMCSGGGQIKERLSLSERIYKCEDCGIEIDRDLNAAINLENYEEKHPESYAGSRG